MGGAGLAGLCPCLVARIASGARQTYWLSCQINSCRACLSGDIPLFLLKAQYRDRPGYLPRDKILLELWLRIILTEALGVA